MRFFWLSSLLLVLIVLNVMCCEDYSPFGTLVGVVLGVMLGRCLRLLPESFTSECRSLLALFLHVLGFFATCRIDRPNRACCICIDLSEWMGQQDLQEMSDFFKELHRSRQPGGTNQ